MKILPESQIYNLPILEEVLEELRLNILDALQYEYDALNLYSMSSKELKEKLGLLGLSSITVGNFISLQLDSDEFEYISPEFYKMYRKLNQHRGNKMSMDYVLHSAGMMNTLVHSNTEFYNGANLFSNTESFFDFSTFRDNQYPELGVGDGYIFVPYSSSKYQLLKNYLAKNPIIFHFLPAGYTFIFLSEYRTGYNCGVLQYDNLLSYLNSATQYWEPYLDYGTDNPYDDTYDVEELILSYTDEPWLYEHHIQYYNPFYWRDYGIMVRNVDYMRYTDDTLYRLPLIWNDGEQTIVCKNLPEYLSYYNNTLMDNMMLLYFDGFESVLNNTLDYKDIWLGDYLIEYLMGSNVNSELPDHVKGLKALHTPTFSMLSMYERGMSWASQYALREDKVVAKYNDNKQIDKKNIISDREELDLFTITFDSIEEERRWDS